MNDSGEAARMELPPDAWHQNDEGNYYIDCPECGSAASLSNVVEHGRCNGYLDQQEAETKLDEEAMTCTAKLWFELGYTSEPDAEPTDDAVGESASDAETEEGVSTAERPPEADETVGEDQQ
ncbi:MAG: hypothetical protein ACOC06_03325 [Halorubrum sp.]